MPVRRSNHPWITAYAIYRCGQLSRLIIFDRILSGVCATTGGMARCARTGTTLVTQTGTTAQMGRRACRWVRVTSATARLAGPENTVVGRRGCPTSGSWASGLSCPYPRLRISTCSSSASSSRSNRPANTASCFSLDTTQHVRSSCVCRCTAVCWNWGSPSEVMIHNI